MIGRFQFFVDEIRKKNKIKNYTFSEREKNYLKHFLMDCYAQKGVMVASFQEQAENGAEINFANFSYTQSKLHPKKESTASMVDALLNISEMDGMNIYLKTGTFSFDKTGEYDFNKMYTTKMMAIDIDDCPEIYEIKTVDAKKTYLRNKYPLLKTLPPTYILATGNKGIQLIYVFTENVFERTGTFTFYNKVLGVMFGADMQRTNIYNSIRMPFSINQKSGRQARIIGKGKIYDYVKFKEKVERIAEDNYIDFDGNIISGKQLRKNYEVSLKFQKDIDDLVEKGVIRENVFDFVYDRYGVQPVQTTKNQHDSGIYDNYRRVQGKTSSHGVPTLKGQIGRYKQIKHDLEKYLDENEGHITGHRNNFIYIMSVTLHYLGYSEESCLKECEFYNSKFSSPLPFGEIKSKVKYAYNHNVRISNYNIKDMLGLSENITSISHNWYSEEEKEEVIKKRNKKVAQKRRKDRDFANRRKKKLNIVLNGLLKGWSVADIARKSGYNEKYIYQLIKQNAFLKYALKIGKKTAKKTLRSITVAKKRGRESGRNFILSHLDSSLPLNALHGLSDFWQLHIDIGGAECCRIVPVGRT